MRRAAALTAIATALGCAPVAADYEKTTPFVQRSVDEPARWFIDINRVRNAIYRAYAPRCIDSVRAGQVIEFRNFLPDVPTNVTSIAGPAPIYSPNLVRPYNYVGPNDPKNELCDVQENGTCTERPAYTYWRAKLDTPGTYDWVDTNQSAGGRKVVDPYYGTTTFIGIDPNAPLGTICIPRTDGSGCAGVCCATDADCSGGTTCARGPQDAIGRCLTPS